MHKNLRRKLAYKITPRDHRSAVWLYGCSRTNSGAMYKGVPDFKICRNRSQKPLDMAVNKGKETE